LPERYSVSVPPVTNIYRRTVPAPKYLPERRSAEFRHHYSPAYVLHKSVINVTLFVTECNKKAALSQGNRAMPQLFFSV